MISILLNLVILVCLSVSGICAAILPNAKTVKRPTGIITAQTAEFTQTLGFQIGHSIRFEFVAENAVGDIPISAVKENLTTETAVNTRRAEIESLLEVANSLQGKPNRKQFEQNEFINNLVAFHGFSFDTFARAKV